MTTPTTTPNDYSNVPLEMTQLVTITSVLEGTQETPVGTQRSFIGQIVPMPNTAAWTQYPYTFKYPAALPIEPKNGQQAWCRVKRENIKAGKDGSRAFDFWWGLTAFDVEAPQPGQETIMGSTPKEQTTNGTTTYSTAQVFGSTATVNSDSIEVRGDIQGHLEKLSVDLYVGVMGISLSDNLDQINYLHIRMIRDRLYHMVKDQLIRPLYYCYEHDEVRHYKDGEYIHDLTKHKGRDLDEGSYCAYQDSILQPFFLCMDTPVAPAEQPVVEQAPAEQPVVEQAVQATLEPATDGLPGGSARE